MFCRKRAIQIRNTWKIVGDDYKEGRGENQGATAYNNEVRSKCPIGCVENGTGRCVEYPI